MGNMMLMMTATLVVKSECDSDGVECVLKWRDDDDGGNRSENHGVDNDFDNSELQVL